MPFTQQKEGIEEHNKRDKLTIVIFSKKRGNTKKYAERERRARTNSIICRVTLSSQSGLFCTIQCNFRGYNGSNSLIQDKNIFFTVRLPQEFLSVSEPLTWLCASTLGTALLCSSRAGSCFELVSFVNQYYIVPKLSLVTNIQIYISKM